MNKREYIYTNDIIMIDVVFLLMLLLLRDVNPAHLELQYVTHNHFNSRYFLHCINSYGFVSHSFFSFMFCNSSNIIAGMTLPTIMPTATKRCCIQTKLKL